MADIVKYAADHKGALSQSFAQSCDPINFDQLPENIRDFITNLEQHNKIPKPDESITDGSGNEYSTIQDGTGTDWTIQGPHTGGKCLFTQTLGRG